ncbi:MAG: hypothetical protein ACHRXM_19300 [Isosphaerales bacterium]
METLRTTLCRFYPDMRHSDRAYDFAILGASNDSLVFWAADLSHYGLKDDNPIVSHVIDHTAEALTRKIESVLFLRKPESGLQALDMLVCDNMSSIQFAPIQELASPRTLVEAVQDRFQAEVFPRVLDQLKSLTVSAHTHRGTEPRQLNASFREIPLSGVLRCEHVHA